MARVRRKYQTLSDFFDKTGTTQDALAEKLSVSRSYVSLIAAGKRQPSLLLALRIESLTGVPVASLVSTEAVAS